MALPRYRRFSVLIAAGFVACLCAAYSGFWYWSAYQLGERLRAWAAARKAEGYELHWDEMRLSGFPGRMQFTLVNASLQRGSPAIYRLSLPEISTAAFAWDLRYWHFTAPKGARMVVADYPDTLTAAKLEGDFALTPLTYDLNVAALALAAGKASATELETRLTLPRAKPLDHRTRGLGLTVELWNLVLPKPVMPLGDKVDSFGIALDFMGALPQGGLKEALAQWRDDGGTVEIRGSELRWGALSLETNGTLALDKDMQPLAGLSTSIVGPDALVDTSVAAGMLPAKNAPLVKLVLTLLSQEGPDGRKRVSAPVTVQDRKVYIGKAQIALMPKIEIE